MKIAICTQKFLPPFVGGVDVYAERLSQSLIRLGHEVILIAVDSTATHNNNKNINVSIDSYKGVKIWRLRFSLSERPIEVFDHLYDPDVGVLVENILKEQLPDLFVVMNFYTITLAVVEAAKSLGIPVAHIVTDFLPICRRATFIRWDGSSCEVGESIKSCAECFISHRTLGRIASQVLNHVPTDKIRQWAGQYQVVPLYHPLNIIKPYLKHAAITAQKLEIVGSLRQKIDFVFAPNRYIMNAYLENGFRADQIYFLPFAIEPGHPLSNTRNIPSSSTRFLFIGRFQPYKGAHLLVEAFNELRTTNKARLTMYGTPDNGYKSYFNSLKTMMESNPDIIYKGQIKPENLNEAFAEADYFVFPSTWHENSPLIILDALQAKTPIIGSRIAGITDIVKDGNNGLLFPMGDKAALMKLMQKVIDYPELKEELKVGISLPLIDEYAQTIINLFQNQLSKNSQNGFSQ